MATVGLHTIPNKKPLTRKELAEGKRLTLGSRSRRRRPRTRGECVDGVRPCPWALCRYHLYVDVKEKSGSLHFNHPDIEIDQLKESCALDVADRGGATLEAVGQLLGVSMERGRQIEVMAAESAFIAVHRLRRKLPPAV